MLQYYFCSYVFGHKAWGILVPWPGIKPEPPAMEGEVWITRPPGKSHHSIINHWIYEQLYDKLGLRIRNKFISCRTPSITPHLQAGQDVSLSYKCQGCYKGAFLHLCTISFIRQGFFLSLSLPWLFPWGKRQKLAIYPVFVGCKFLNWSPPISTQEM